MHKVGAMLCVAVIAVATAGCGGGSSSGGRSSNLPSTDAGGSNGGGSADSGFTNDVSGTWTGSVAGPIRSSVVVMISQPIPNLGGDVQDFTGTFKALGTTFPMTGTKEGNTITMVVTIDVTYTFSGELTDADTMKGNLLQGDTVVEADSWKLTR